MAGLTNKACWRQAQRYLVGGVNSPVRSFKAVGGNPFFVDRGDGAYLWDVEGRRYLDYVCSWGALILGHRHPVVLKAVQEALRRGTTFGTPTPQETLLAKAIHEAVPSMEQVRFVSSGTEAVMSAVRLARAATGRRKILKFDGAYHGHVDALLTKAGSGLATLGLPASPGIPAGVTEDTITVRFNDLQAVQQAIHRTRKDLACVLVEPIMANIGLIPPHDGFLQSLREWTQEDRVLLIFDEVITGFRVAYGGAQELYGVRPDLTVFGKVIGGGFPIGAYGGARKLMSQVAPSGPVYQAGTLSGHPVTMAAGLATLRFLQRSNPYPQLARSGVQLREGLVEQSAQMGLPLQAQQVGSLLHLTMGSRRYATYFQKMLRHGVYLPPSAFEVWFLSTAMGSKELELTVKAHRDVLKSLGNHE